MSILELPPIEAVLEMHDDQIEEHGGGFGHLDIGRLEAALARAHNVMEYGDGDIFDAVAALMSGVANNNPFVDGNKRTAAVVGVVTLDINGHELDVTNRDMVVKLEGLLTHEFTEQQIAEWLRENSDNRANIVNLTDASKQIVARGG